jgi:hypothetical protein
MELGGKLCSISVSVGGRGFNRRTDGRAVAGVGWNPYRVLFLVTCVLPRVVRRGGQPWALGLNPVGILVARNS